MQTYIIVNSQTLEIQADNLDIAMQISSSYEGDEAGVVEQISVDKNLVDSSGKVIESLL